MADCHLLQRGTTLAAGEGMRAVVWLGLALAAVTSSAPAFSWVSPPSVHTVSRGVRADTPDPSSGKKIRDSWTLSLEAAMQAPIDLGGRVGIEAPFGVRAFAGYAWIPPLYIDALTGLAARTSSGPITQAILEEGDFTGNTWRLGLGVRPFRKLGLYLDAGYVRGLLDASVALQSTDIAELREQNGGYAMNTRLDMWFFELGYQAKIGDRLVLAGGLGMLGTFNASTTLTATGGAPNATALSRVATNVDGAFEKYGFVPTLSFRIGVDLM